MTRRDFFASTGIALLTVGFPVWYWVQSRLDYRNFHEVEPGKLYRSGQLKPDTFARVLREYHIGTVFSLRDTKDDRGVPEDQWEADLCRAAGVAYYRQSPADWTPVDGEIPGDKNVAEFLRILRDRQTRWPVLVHCFAGIHRTGVHCAVYRIERDGWTPAEALAELQSFGTPRTTFADNLIHYVESYTRGRLDPPDSDSTKR
ncbi:MAG TPA: tyrosine-protein phosphatase [Fimbriiglobus sp.]|jgi:protein tyrosine/serine phosphatase